MIPADTYRSGVRDLISQFITPVTRCMIFETDDRIVLLRFNRD